MRQKLWSVPRNARSPGFTPSRASRFLNSPAASLLKVMHARPRGACIRSANKYAAFTTSVAVLPEPGPASTTVLRDARTAFFWYLFSSPKAFSSALTVIPNPFNNYLYCICDVARGFPASELISETLGETAFSDPIYPRNHGLTHAWCFRILSFL